jgi:hydroxypyruvate isomerase
MLQFSGNLSLLFTEYPLIDRFAAARQAGFRAVEIQFPYELTITQIQQQLEQHQLKLVLFNVDADTLLAGGEGLAAVPDKQTQFTQAVEQTATYAEALKPVAINILPGRCLNPDKQSIYLDTFKKNLVYAADRFSELGIKTVFEAVNTYDMPGFIIHSGRQMLDILEELKHPGLAMQYDIYHVSRMGEDCADFLQKHLDKIGHIQFADCPGRGEIGSGQIDFKRLFKIIADSDYRGWTGAEYRPTTSTRESLKALQHYF